jgi:hypothetical protein
MLKSLALNLENSYFKKILRSSLKVLADISIFRGDLVQIEVYNKLNGSLIMASTWWIIGLKHTLEDGMLYTYLDLAPSDVTPIVSVLSEKSDVNAVLGLDQQKEDALKQVSEQYSKIKGLVQNYISGITT